MMKRCNEETTVNEHQNPAPAEPRSKTRAPKNPRPPIEWRVATRPPIPEDFIHDPNDADDPLGWLLREL